MLQMRSRAYRRHQRARIKARHHDHGWSNALPLSGSKKLVDEGVCIRAESQVPCILKAKSPIFLQFETKMLDKEADDLEAAA